MKPFLIGTLTIILGSVTQQIVNAETIPRLYGNAAGADYCRLRQLGISDQKAYEIAVERNLAQDEFEDVLYIKGGKKTSAGSLDMVRHVITHCFDAVPLD